MDNTCVTMTISFSQEAHKMVNEANVKQAGAEKQLKEAQGKVCDAFVTLCNIRIPSPYWFSSHHQTFVSFNFYFSVYFLSPRLMFFRQRWQRSRLLCWHQHLLPQTASCILSYRRRERGGGTDTSAATSATKAQAGPFHLYLENKKTPRFPFSLRPKRTER